MGKVCLILVGRRRLFYPNGSLGKMFKSSRSLREGDPLFATIFVLTKKLITQFFYKAQEVGVINGFVVRNNSKGILLP